MEKNLIKEELKRIHSLTYGEKVLSEQEWWDNIIDFLKPKKNQKKQDDPKKADFLSSDVDQFFSILEEVKDSGGLVQQTSGSYEYQIGVEAMQVALILLGYELPKHGVDGLFGPETADAVKKFMSDKIIKESIGKRNISEVKLMSPLGKPIGSGGDFLKHRSGLDKPGKKHAGVDLHAKYDPVYSPADGVVIDSAIRNNACGGTLYIDHKNGFKSRYCHLKQIFVNKGDTVEQGEKVAISGGGKNDGISRGHSTGPHLHFELYKDGKLVNPAKYIGSEVGQSDITKDSEEKTTEDSNLLKANSAFFSKLIELLKLKNIKSEDLKKYIRMCDIKK